MKLEEEYFALRQTATLLTSIVLYSTGHWIGGSVCLLMFLMWGYCND